MTPPLIFSLLCHKKRLFIQNRIAGLPYFHNPIERYRNLLLVLKYFAATAAIIYLLYHCLDIQEAVVFQREILVLKLLGIFIVVNRYFMQFYVITCLKRNFHNVMYLFNFVVVIKMFK